jgi:hypothetical protein
VWVVISLGVATLIGVIGYGMTVRENHRWTVPPARRSS